MVIVYHIAQESPFFTIAFFAYQPLPHITTMTYLPIILTSHPYPNSQLSLPKSLPHFSKSLLGVIPLSPIHPFKTPLPLFQFFSTFSIDSNKCTCDCISVFLTRQFKLFEGIMLMPCSCSFYCLKKDTLHNLCCTLGVLYFNHRFMWFSSMDSCGSLLSFILKVFERILKVSLFIISLNRCHHYMTNAN